MTSSYEVGDGTVLIRTSRGDLDAVLREIFGGRPLDAPSDTYPDYSVWMPSAADGPSSRLPTLFRGCTPVLRSRSLERLVQGLHGHLADGTNVHRDDVVALEAIALVAPDNGAAALLPRSVRHLRGALLQVLERHEVRVVDGHLALLSPQTGALVVPAGIELGDHARRLHAILPTPPAPAPLGDGHYDIQLWFRGSKDLRRSALLVHAMRRMLRNGTSVGFGRALKTLGRTLREAEVVSLASVSQTNKIPDIGRGIATRMNSLDPP